ncbi:hypothetical protein C4G53_RS23845 [Vibrio parahaemolyticus]|nr:hypothetical protein [Vibrio parahaemolyticus]EJS4017099.1 hypothetical protein [Vibrio parahaemolyticus]
MCKRINALWVGVFFFLCSSAFANDEVDWSVFAAWCPASFDVCAGELTLSESVESGELLAPEYHAPNDDDTRLFSELLSVYDALTQGQKVSELESYIRRLSADIEMREQLHRYAIGEGELPALPQRSELRHYRKELMYLKSLQSINQKQKQLLNAHQNEDEKAFIELKSQVATLEKQLNEATFAIKDQLEGDIKSEGDILRYFIYKREQAGE